MSWEECGFRPGTVHGRAECPKGACSECDGRHHFYAETADAVLHDGEPGDEFDVAARDAVAAGHSEFFACKHCGTWAEMVDDDDLESEDGL